MPMLLVLPDVGAESASTAEKPCEAHYVLTDSIDCAKGNGSLVVFIACYFFDKAETFIRTCAVKR
jgi:hypothetical protein